MVEEISERNTEGEFVITSNCLCWDAREREAEGKHLKELQPGHKKNKD